MKKQNLLIILLLMCCGLSAQTINGTIKSKDKLIESATISLKQQKSEILKQTTSDLSGYFSFEKLQPGNYSINVEMVSFKKYTTEIKVEEGKATTVNIDLVQEIKDLGAVTVVSKKPFIEQKPGKTVMNVDASPSNTGLNVLELLEKAPGVTVDNDGNISLKGKQGVLVLIDGKQSFLSGADLAAFLKNMQSTQLDQVEIMTNPPAKYDASGSSGIINIKTKKQIIKGMNGSVNANYNQGWYGRPNINTNFNYRNNKLNIFGSYGYNLWEGRNEMTLSRRFYEADKKTISGSIDQLTIQRNTWNNHNSKLGIDYYFDKNNVAGIVVNAGFNTGHQNPHGTSFLREADYTLESKILTDGSSNRNNNNYTANFNYKHTFDTTGREISTDIDYSRYTQKDNSSLNTTSVDNFDNTTSFNQLKGYIPSNINIYSGKIDYVHPINKKLRLETGVKTSFVETDNIVDYTRNDNNAGWKLDSRSNHFIYKENINAAYAILNAGLKKWNISAGLRFENTISKGDQITTDSSFKRDYTNLFPNIGIGYDMNEKNQFNFSYARRINRPDYGDLNPFIHFLDSLTYNQGNPYLRPEFSNNFEASYTWNRILTATVNYSKTTDVITMLIKQDTDKKIAYQTRDNLNSNSQIGISLMFNMPVKKWWNVNVYTNMFTNNFKGLYNNDKVNIKANAFNVNFNNNFNFNKGWGAELSGFYVSKRTEGLLIAKAQGQINIGASKQILKNKGSIKLSIRDIFYTNNFRGYIRYSDVDFDLKGKRDSRQLSISFNYRFGKQSIGSERRRKVGADEQNRVKN